MPGWLRVLALLLACGPLQAAPGIDTPFHRVFAQAAAPMLLIEPESGRIVDANPAAAAFYGHAREALQALTIQDINTLTPEQVTQERALAASQQRNHFVFTHRLANDERRTVKVASSPVRVDGRLLLLSIVTDITPGPHDEHILQHFQQRLEAQVAQQTREIEAHRQTQVWSLGAGLVLLALLALVMGLSLRRGRRLRHALRDANARLKAMLGAFPDLLFEVDDHECCVSVHTSHPDKLPMPLDRFAGQPMTEILPAHGVVVARRAMDEARRHGISAAHTYEMEVQGQTRLFELIASHKAPNPRLPGGYVFVVRDITERHAERTRLQLAASVFSHAREGIVITDAQGTILDVNDTFTAVTGYPRDEVVGLNPRMLQSGRQDAGFYRRMWASLRENGHWTGELWNRRRDGTEYAEQLTISAVHDEAGKVSHFVGLFSNITELKQHQQALEYIAHHDALTGLPNRVLLARLLERALVDCRRLHSSLAVLLLDLDGFKDINDRHGHEVGDRLLATLADTMRAALRESDMLARIGGDEFVVVLPDQSAVAPCRAVIERLLRAVAEPVQVDEHRLQVTASVGATLFPDDPGDADQLLRHADLAMYQAKQAGKNRFRFFDVAHDRAVKAQTEHVERVLKAMERGELVLHFQPQVHLGTRALVGLEALLRWQHPDDGLLAPGRFLPLLQGTHLLGQLDEWVLEQAFAHLATWQAQGHRLVPVSVNISAHTMQRPGLAQRIQALQVRHPQVPLSHLKLEVLETSALEDLVISQGVMKECLDIGVKFALDDFGTGYSSLAYLRRLPAGQLKIDQSFVRNMLEDAGDRAIVQGILGLAHAFTREVIAEGVETEDLAAALLDMGCELGQGYGIARPMAADGLREWLGSV